MRGKALPQKVNFKGFSPTKGGKSSTAEAVTEKKKIEKEFVSEVQTQIKHIRLNLKESTALNITFDGKDVEEASLEGTNYNSGEPGLIDRMDNGQWGWIISASDKDFKEGIETLRKTREEVRKLIEE